MKLKIIFILFGFIVLMFGGYYLSLESISNNPQSFSFSIKQVYSFHGWFSLVLCILIFLLAKTQRFVNQIGFIYLFSFVLKLILFSVVFKSYVINLQLSTVNEALIFLSPLFIALVFEVLFVAQILNRNQEAKNG